MFVLIDLDETLVSRRSAFDRWAAEFVADRGLDRHDLDAIIDLDRHADDRAGFFGKLADRFALDPMAVWAQYRARMPHLVRPFDGVPEALAKLRVRGWRIGVASNGRADTQVGKLRMTGLDQLVDAVTVSETIGARKPDGAFFDAAIASLHAAGEVWILGDDPIHDIAGGRNAGLLTAWVSHGREWPLGGEGPDLRAERTAPLLSMLAEH